MTLRKHYRTSSVLFKSSLLYIEQYVLLPGTITSAHTRYSCCCCSSRLLVQQYTSSIKCTVKNKYTATLFTAVQYFPPALRLFLGVPRIGIARRVLLVTRRGVLIFGIVLRRVYLPPPPPLHLLLLVRPLVVVADKQPPRCRCWCRLHHGDSGCCRRC